MSEVRLNLGKCVKSKFMKNITSIFLKVNVMKIDVVFFEINIDF